MNNRPAALTVLAILSIIWGAGAILMSCGGWIMYFVPMGPANPALEELKHSLVYKVMLFGLGSVGLMLALGLLAGGIGALSIKPWSRTTLRVYAIGKIVLVVIQTILNALFIIPKTYEATISGPGMPAGMEKIMIVSLIVGGCIGVLIALAMPVYILITLRMRAVKDAFNGIFPPQGGFEMNMPQQ